MSESDSDSEIERCSSVKSIPEVFEKVPANADFNFRFFGSQCSKSGTKLIFPLKVGKELPYLTHTITKKGKGNYLLTFEHLNGDYVSFILKFLLSSSPSRWSHQWRVMWAIRRKIGGSLKKKVG
jgi:hypothetical protein